MTAWILMEHCGECGQPSRQFIICNVLGYNPGVDGHLFGTEGEARKAMSLFDAEAEGKSCADRGVKPYEIKLSPKE